MSSARYNSDAVAEEAVRIGLLFGILSQPRAQPARTAILFLNAGLIHRVGPFRLYVHLARALAATGFPSLRIDQSGKGDSPHRTGAATEDVLLADFDDSYAFLRDRYSTDKVVVIGLCSGADDAVRLAAARPEVAGVVLFDGWAARDLKYYIHRYLPKLLSLHSWKNRITRRLASGENRIQMVDRFDFRHWDDNRDMTKKMVAFLRRGVEVLAVFTTGAYRYYSYHGQLRNNLGVSRRLEEHYFEDAGHIYPIGLHRERAIETVLRWAQERFVPTR